MENTNLSLNPISETSKTFWDWQKGYFWAPLLIIIVILVTILVCFGVYNYAQNCSLVGAKSAWKAVFLDSGQVYFGKVSSETKQTIVLRQVHYIQPLNQSTKNANQQPQFTLVKLGDEIYGPTNEIRLNRSHILFMETLKADSDVVKTIEGSAAKK